MLFGAGDFRVAPCFSLHYRFCSALLRVTVPLMNTKTICEPLHSPSFCGCRFIEPLTPSRKCRKCPQTTCPRAQRALPGTGMTFLAPCSPVRYGMHECSEMRSAIANSNAPLSQKKMLKKAVAVSEEQIQERSRRRGQLFSRHFACRKVPKLWHG